MSSYKFIAATALLSALPSVFAGTAIIKNNCDFPVFITHSANGADQAQKQYNTGDEYNQAIEGDAVCLKIMTEKGFCMTDNCVQLEYTSQPSMLWYDLSNINAQAMKSFINHGMTVNVSDSSAQQINCPVGKATCENTYYQPWEDVNSLSAKPDSDLTMNLCSANMGSSNSGSSSSSSASSHHDTQSSAVAPAAPATTNAPHVAQVDAAGGPVVEVTVTHTVMGREAEPTEAPEKRHIHAHAHHHRH